FSSRRRHTRSKRDWSSDVCSSDLADDKFQSILQPIAVHDVLDGLPRLGADDAQADAPAAEAPEQLRRPGKQSGLLPLAGLGHLQEVGPELGLVVRVPIPGEELIGVLQQVADGAPHRLPVGDGLPQPGKAVLEARHNGVGGVSQGVVKIKTDSAVCFHMVSYSLGRARRPLALEMPSSSRYLATVRREMVTPSPSSSWHSFWSDRGRALSSPSTSSLSRLLI